MGLYFTDEKAKAKRVTAQATHTEPISEPRWKDSRIYTHNHRTILPPTLQEILGVGYARMRLVMKEYTVSIQKCCLTRPTQPRSLPAIYSDLEWPQA